MNSRKSFLILVLFFSYNIAYSQALDTKDDTIKEISKQQEEIRILIGSATYDWEENQKIGQINNRSKTLKSKDIQRVVGFPGVMDVYATDGFSNSYIKAYREALITDRTINLLIPELVIAPVLTSVNFNIIGKKQTEYQGKCEAEGYWRLSTLREKNKVISKIPFKVSYRREIESNEYLFAPFFVEAAKDLLLSDSIPDYLRQLEKNIYNTIRGKPIHLKTKVFIGDKNGNDNIISKSIQSVVTINLENSFGSGVVVSSDGYIITNQHVVEGYKKVIVTFNSRKEYEAEVIKTNPSFDVALLKIEADSLSFLRLKKESDTQIGQEVFAIGTPLSNELSQTVSKGIVSGIRTINKSSLIQTDVSINSGNSGGALIDKSGELIAIPTFKATIDNSEGIGFCIPTATVIEALNLIQ